MKLWIDDIREAPRDYIWIKETNSALRFIRMHAADIELIDLDHDAGDYVKEGGDYIGILRELERLTRSPHHKMDFSHIKFRLHSANPVGVANMRAIIEANGWKEIK
jgi:hypothetical protein